MSESKKVLLKNQHVPSATHAYIQWPGPFVEQLLKYDIGTRTVTRVSRRGFIVS